jgi:hypothetical protein
MTGLQAFALGIMTTLTPSFLVFAVILWRAPAAEDNADQDNADPAKMPGRKIATRHRAVAPW